VESKSSCEGKQGKDEDRRKNAWQNKPRVGIEKRNAWQNKPHKTSKSMAEGEQGKDGDRQKKCMAN
jgi:hypothetical protein